MTRAFTIAAALAFGCSDDPQPLTWGDATLQMATAYCAAGADCGFNVRSACADHVRWHACEPDRSCNVELPAEAQVAVDACVVALDQPDATACGLLYYGFLPAECDLFFEFDPGEQP